MDTSLPTSPALAHASLGSYELIEEIARGGMGVVYKARQRSLNRIVAVKTILSGKLASPSQVDRFFAEAKTVARLKHPHIVDVHEAGVENGVHYFAMDFVEGRNLEDAIRDGPPNPARAAEWVKIIALAVQYAHEQGVLHRDLKPSNVLIDQNGSPRLTDFGLAKQLDENVNLTQTGAVLGSPQYMSPEQAHGDKKRVGPASDVYGLGVILYQLLTGRVPFSGQTLAETLRLIQNKPPPPPSSIKSGIPTDLETICLKCLEKNPGLRYESAAALAGDLDRFLNFRSIQAKPSTAVRGFIDWFQNNPWTLTGIASGLGLILFCGMFGLWERTRYMGWKLTTRGNEQPAFFEFPLIHFFLVLPALGLLLEFCSRRFQTEWRQCRESGAIFPNRSLWINGMASLLGVAFVIRCILIQIHTWVWRGPDAKMWLEIVGLGCVGGLLWISLSMLWQVLASHQFSRFSDAVDRHLSSRGLGRNQSWGYSEIFGYASAGGLLFILLYAYLILSLTYNVAIFLSGGLALLYALLLLAGLERFAQLKANPMSMVFAPTFLLCVALYAVAATYYSFLKNTAWAVILIAPPGLWMLASLRILRKRSGRSSGSSQWLFLNAPARKLRQMNIVGGLGGLLASLCAIGLLILIENARGREAWNRLAADDSSHAATNLLSTLMADHATRNIRDQRFEWRLRKLNANEPLDAGFQTEAEEKFDEEAVNELDRLAGMEGETGVSRITRIPGMRAVLAFNSAPALARRGERELEKSNPDGAMKSLQVLCRLAKAAGQQRSYKGSLAAAVHFSAAFRVARTGLRARLWSMTDLQDIQESLEGVQLIRDLQEGLLASRLEAVNYTFSSFWKDGLWERYRINYFPWTPEGWRYQNLRAYNEEFRAWALPCLDPERQRVLPNRVDLLDRRQRELAAGIHPFFRLSRLLLQLTPSVFIIVGETQDELRLLRLALDLETCRIDQGQYPESLSLLPHGEAHAAVESARGGGSFVYRRIESDAYELFLGYSEFKCPSNIRNPF